MNIFEIDSLATRGDPKQFNDEASSLLRVLKCGGAWGKEALHVIDRADDLQCELCGGGELNTLLSTLRFTARILKL